MSRDGAEDVEEHVDLDLPRIFDAHAAVHGPEMHEQDTTDGYDQPRHDPADPNLQLIKSGVSDAVV